MRAATAAVLVALACLLAACGNSSSAKPPQGNPDARFGPQAVDDYAAVELLRAQLIAAGDGYASGAPASDARTQLNQARVAYSVLEPRVKAKDPIVDREVAARFAKVEQEIAKPIGRQAFAGSIGPLFDQLMDGVAQALVREKARDDRGLQAETLRRVVARLAGTYDSAASALDAQTERLAFQQSWGLWRRASTIDGPLSATLGPDSGTVTNTISNMKGYAFPNGALPLANPPANKVDEDSAKVIAALVKRYGLGS